MINTRFVDLWDNVIKYMRDLTISSSPADLPDRHAVGTVSLTRGVMEFSDHFGVMTKAPDDREFMIIKTTTKDNRPIEIRIAVGYGANDLEDDCRSHIEGSHPSAI